MDTPQTNGGTVDATRNGQDIETWLLETLGAQSGLRDRINRDVKVGELDIDSLDMIEIWQMMDEDFGLTVDPFALRKARTVGEILDIVAGRAS